MKEKGLTTYRIRKDKIVSENAMTSMRAGKSVTMETIAALCKALDCQPGDIVEYISDDLIDNAPLPAEQPWSPIIKELSAEGAAELTEKQQATILMDKFIDLQRIKTAADREREIEYQLRTTKAKLKALGIVTEALTIEA